LRARREEEGGRKGGRVYLREGDVGECLGSRMDDIEVLHNGGAIVGDGHRATVVPDEEGGREKGGAEGGGGTRLIE